MLVWFAELESIGRQGPCKEPAGTQNAHYEGSSQTTAEPHCVFGWAVWIWDCMLLHCRYLQIPWKKNSCQGASALGSFKHVITTAIQSFKEKLQLKKKSHLWSHTQQYGTKFSLTFPLGYDTKKKKKKRNGESQHCVFWGENKCLF